MIDRTCLKLRLQGLHDHCFTKLLLEIPFEDRHYLFRSIVSEYLSANKVQDFSNTPDFLPLSADLPS